MWKGRDGAGWQRTHQARSRQGRVLETERLCMMPLRVGPLSIFVVYFVIVKVYAIVMSCRSIHAFSWKPSCQVLLAGPNSQGHANTDRYAWG